MEQFFTGLLVGALVGTGIGIVAFAIYMLIEWIRWSKKW